jgi:hypothetical protein
MPPTDGGSGDRPKLIASSVVRGAEQGQSHGGLCIVDLAAGSADYVLDWNSTDIDVEGRGGDRGLRGIGVAGDSVFVLSSASLLEFDSRLRLRQGFDNPYLKHCHELSIHDGRLYAVSTGYDSVLVFDLGKRAFVQGFHLCIRQSRMRVLAFDPNSRDGPPPANRFHLNSVKCDARGLFFSGLRSNGLLSVREGKLSRAAPLPPGTHNAQPLPAGIAYNDTVRDRICARIEGEEIHIPVAVGPHAGCAPAEGDAALARPFFARGLYPVSDSLVAGGASPSTITLYDLRGKAAVAQVVISTDVRNAVHGLTRWPY